MNSSGAAGDIFVFTFVNLSDNTVYTENRKYIFIIIIIIIISSSSSSSSSSSAVSSEFKLLDARKLTCLQPLPNAVYANYYSLKHPSFHPSF